MSTSFIAKRHITAPPDVVFAKASDFRNAADFISGITKTEVLTDGPVGVGTRFLETRVMFGKEHSEEMVVKAFEPPRRYELEAFGCGCLYQTEFRFTPQADGTEVQMTFTATPQTTFAKILGFLMKPMMKSCMKMVERDFDDMKAAIEGGGATGGESVQSQPT